MTITGKYESFEKEEVFLMMSWEELFEIQIGMDWLKTLLKAYCPNEPMPRYLKKFAQLIDATDDQISENAFGIRKTRIEVK